MKRVLTPEEREKISRDLRSRILNVLPAATYQMDRFLCMVDVVVSDLSETACVEVGPQPRLHLNTKFIAKHCRRDEHLLMLVLHEIYHIILGHTRLFPRMTRAHNIAFDAIINSMLCHQFRETVYIEFFQKLNPWTRFPSRLLRPPPGWLNGTKILHPKLAPEERAVIALLYGDRSKTVTYHEIFELLKKHIAPEDNAECVLLGDHSGLSLGGEKDNTCVNDEAFKKILGQVAKEWPKEAGDKLMKGVGSDLLDYLLPKARSPRAEFLIALKQLLYKTGLLRNDRCTVYAWQKIQFGIETAMALPNWRDRNAHSREIMLGEAPLFYKSDVQVSGARWKPRNAAHVYIDVSGSMEDSLPWLVGAMEPLQRRGLCRLYAFSTVVDEVKKGNLASNRIKNTFGTDINCVYRHVIDLTSRRTPNKVVVLTDGYTGVPDPQYRIEWEKRKIALYVGIIGTGHSKRLDPFAKLVQRLPEFN